MTDLTATRVRLPTPEFQRTNVVTQSLVIARRNLIHIKRLPETLLDVTVQPVMFVLLFAFVFGGSIHVASTGSSSGYREWLLPGIMAQTICFSSIIVATGLNHDLEKGIVDRFRSLPIARTAVLIGRSMSSLIHSSLGVAVMALTGLIVGWRIRGGLWEAVLAFVLLLLFGFAMIWLGILAGAAMRSPEAVNGLMFTLMFPITFLANTFAPTANMPAALRLIAEWNPISSLVQAMRVLWGNAPSAGPGASFPLQHPIAMTIVWTAALIVIVAPWSLAVFRRRTET